MKILKHILLFTLLLALSTTLLCSCALPEKWFPGEEPPEEPHTHKWGNWLTELSPTCEAGGQEVRVCACGERETNTTDATGAHVLGANNTCTFCGKALQPTEGLEFEALTSTTCEVVGIGSAEGTTLVIPHTYEGMSVTQIGAEAFMDQTTLTCVILPHTLKIIDEYAFYNCTALKALAIPTTVTQIKQQAFYSCYSVTSLSFGTASSLRTIGALAFYCLDIKTLDFGDNSQLRTIGESAFFSCNRLTSIRFGEGSRLVTIDKYAFNACSSLTLVTLPSNVAYLRQGAFYDCKNLTTIVLPKSLSSIEKSAFLLCDSLRNIYYCGTTADWDRLSVHSEVGRYFTESTVYYYSESPVPSGGNILYWHYAPTPW